MYILKVAEIKTPLTKYVESKMPKAGFFNSDLGLLISGLFWLPGFPLITTAFCRMMNGNCTLPHSINNYRWSTHFYLYPGNALFTHAQQYETVKDRTGKNLLKVWCNRQYFNLQTRLIIITWLSTSVLILLVKQLCCSSETKTALHFYFLNPVRWLALCNSRFYKTFAARAGFDKSGSPYLVGQD